MSPAERLASECPRGASAVLHESGYLRHYIVFGQLSCVMFEVLCQQALPRGSRPSTAQTLADDDKEQQRSELLLCRPPMG